MNTLDKTSNYQAKNKVESYGIGRSDEHTPAPMRVNRPATAAEAVAAKNATDAAAGVVYLSERQKELILILLNSHAIKRGQKMQMLLNINRVTRERAMLSISRLITTIEAAGEPLPYDLAERQAAIAAEVDTTDLAA